MRAKNGGTFQWPTINFTILKIFILEWELSKNKLSNLPNIRILGTVKAIFDHCDILVFWLLVLEVTDICEEVLNHSQTNIEDSNSALP